MGMDLPSTEGGISDYSFGGNTNVSGFDASGLGGGGAPEATPEASAGWGEGAAAGFDPQAGTRLFTRTGAKIRDANESARLLGEQITSVAPGNQTNFALGAINTPVAPIQHTPITPVNMSGVFAPLPTAAFMPRFTF